MFFVLNPLYIGIWLIFVKLTNFADTFPVKHKVDGRTVQISNHTCYNRKNEVVRSTPFRSCHKQECIEKLIGPIVAVNPLDRWRRLQIAFCQKYP